MSHNKAKLACHAQRCPAKHSHVAAPGSEICTADMNVPCILRVAGKEQGFRSNRSGLDLNARLAVCPCNQPATHSASTQCQTSHGHNHDPDGCVQGRYTGGQAQSTSPDHCKWYPCLFSSRTCSGTREAGAAPRWAVTQIFFLATLVEQSDPSQHHQHGNVSLHLSLLEGHEEDLCPCVAPILANPEAVMRKQSVATHA